MRDEEEEEEEVEEGGGGGGEGGDTHTSTPVLNMDIPPAPPVSFLPVR